MSLIKRIFGVKPEETRESDTERLNNLVSERNRHMKVIFERLSMLQIAVKEPETKISEVIHLLPETLLRNLTSSNEGIVSFISQKIGPMELFIKEKGALHTDETVEIKEKYKRFSSVLMNLNNLDEKTSELFDFIRKFMSILNDDSREESIRKSEASTEYNTYAFSYESKSIDQKKAELLL